MFLAIIFFCSIIGCRDALLQEREKHNGLVLDCAIWDHIHPGDAYFAASASMVPASGNAGLFGGVPLFCSSKWMGQPIGGVRSTGHLSGKVSAVAAPANLQSGC